MTLPLEEATFTITFQEEETVLLAKLLSRVVRVGRLVMIDALGKTHVFGDGAPGQPSATFRLHDRSLHRQILLNPKLRIGEAYMAGTLTIEDGTLYDFIDVLALNLDNFERDTLVGTLGGWLSRVTRGLQQYNPVGRAQKNVAHHYDLSGSLYDLFLDKDRQYSCAYFSNNNESLEEAQQSKKLHLAAKLLLQPGQKVLDIGSGWGGLALYLAKTAKVDVTGVTLSQEQHGVSEARARDEGLDDKVHFKLLDYREEDARYDRIVSVGMFEHVGAVHYREFFRKIRDLLVDDGVALLHTIGRMTPPGSTNVWLRKYIFPGGYTPALSETAAAIEREGLWITDVEVLRLHYADTLREWRRRFQANRDKVQALYDERFCWIWNTT
ncbi:MAG: cyclopropane-fatty-acyl-phospholipid synthase family protein [Bauldia litoralis]